MQSGPLRVFYNASALPERPAGAGVYTIELGRALAARDDLSLTVAAPRNILFGEHLQSPSGGRIARIARELRRMSGDIQRAEADVYHGPHFFTPRVSVPTVATIHDLTFYRMPKRYSRQHLAYYRYLAGTTNRANYVIVPSATVASDVVRFLGRRPESIRVIAEAPRAGYAPATQAAVSAVRERYQLPARYLLSLGTAEPGKRAVDAVRAMPAILERHPDVVLVLAGNAGRLSEPLAREAERLGVASAVRTTGYVPDEDLAALLTGAAALLFPSIYEGFGLPPLEAMACGTPVIASDAPAMSEVLAGTAILVPLRDPAALAREASKLLDSTGLSAELSARSLEHARGFSWAKAAAETVDVYREAVR